MPGVIGVHKVRLRQSGGVIHGDLHVVMDQNISFVDGHKIATDVEQHLAKFSNDIVVHFEPGIDLQESMNHIEEAKTVVARIMNENNLDFKDYHELDVSQRNNGTSITMHVVLPKGTSVQDARARCDKLEKSIKCELGEASVNFFMEPCDSSCIECKEKCTDA